MKFEFSPRMTYVDAFGSLLDVAGDSHVCVCDAASDEAVIYSVDEHFNNVGHRMREAMATIESEEGVDIWVTGRHMQHR